MRIAILLLLLVSTPVASSWLDIWKNADQRGKALLDRGEPEQAVDTFDDAQWRGTAQFRVGDFAGAADSFAKSEGADALYNRATALAHAQAWEQSLQVYSALLEQYPEHQDGRFNYDKIKQWLQQQSQSQGQAQQGQRSQEQQGDRQQQSGQASEQQQSQRDQSAQSSDQAQDDASAEAAAQSQSGEQQSARQAFQSALDEQQKIDEEKQRDSLMQEQNKPQESDQAAQQQAQVGTGKPFDESLQAIAQQLNRIPDDPGGLLRNKLYVTHQLRYKDIQRGDQPW